MADNRSLEQMRAVLGERILVLGCPGSGKTTLATKLAEATGLPCTHLDEEYFGPGWQPRPDPAWRRRLIELTGEPRWVVDGNHAWTLDARLPRATGVVLVDESAWRCIGRWLKCTIRLTFINSARLPHYMRDPVTGRRRVVSHPVRFAIFIATFRRRVLPGMLMAIRSSPSIRIIHYGRKARRTGGRPHDR